MGLNKSGKKMRLKQEKKGIPTTQRIQKSKEYDDAHTHVSFTNTHKNNENKDKTYKCIRGSKPILKDKIK